jgi:hypothetical protein
MNNNTKTKKPCCRQNRDDVPGCQSSGHTEVQGLAPRSQRNGPNQSYEVTPGPSEVISNRPGLTINCHIKSNDRSRKTKNGDDRSVDQVCSIHGRGECSNAKDARSPKALLSSRFISAEPSAQGYALPAGRNSRTLRRSDRTGR